MVTEVAVTTAAPITVEVVADETVVNVTETPSAVVTATGAQTQTNLWVSDTYPGFITQGIWVQTNLDGDKEKVTLNLVYDDGT